MSISLDWGQAKYIMQIDAYYIIDLAMCYIVPQRNTFVSHNVAELHLTKTFMCMAISYHQVHQYGAKRSRNVTFQQKTVVSEDNESAIALQ